jgi:hypothetical protein
MSWDHDRCFSILVLGAFSTGVFKTNALPHINIGADVWGESSIVTGVYQHWCSSTLHIGWGLCDRLCPVLVCRGRYGLGGGVLLFILGSNMVGQDRKGVFGGGEEGGGVRSGPGAARTILLFHIISARPSKQPLMVRTFLKVYMSLPPIFCFCKNK